MIFGVEAPKIVNGQTTVLLDYAVMDPKFCIGDIIENTSPMNGEKTFIMKGDYAEFKLDIYLFKYGNTSSRKSKFLEIYNQRKNLVDFYPHRDGGPIKNEDNEIVKFAIVDCYPFYFQNEVTHDAVMLHLKSKKYIDITKSLV
ncbi:MAG: hypothetical protein KGZ42_07595 [Melioribacter sp.]|nr:hypothetical protein [Melioribacter sp.]